jgi:hypothetical protein
MQQSGEEQGEKYQSSGIALKPQPQDTKTTNQCLNDTPKDEVQWGDGTAIIEEEPGSESIQGTWPSYVATI